MKTKENPTVPNQLRNNMKNEEYHTVPKSTKE
jgi:hypothetical protein